MMSTPVQNLFALSLGKYSGWGTKSNLENVCSISTTQRIKALLNLG